MLSLWLAYDLYQIVSLRDRARYVTAASGTLAWKAETPAHRQNYDVPIPSLEAISFGMVTAVLGRYIGRYRPLRRAL